jgi:hypothetical protein
VSEARKIGNLAGKPQQNVAAIPDEQVRIATATTRFRMHLKPPPTERMGRFGHFHPTAAGLVVLGASVVRVVEGGINRGFRSTRSLTMP